jgi:2-C-methyl-D-erythritol 4-phosphate cytidylyltransferase
MAAGANPTAVAVIAAAGRGERLRAGENKVFLPVSGVPMLAWALRGLHDCPEVGAIVVVVGAGEELQAAEVALRAAVDCRVVVGAETRGGSVLRGLEAAREFALPIVAIHDGARPFVTPELASRTIGCAETCGATGASRPVTDTIKLTEPDGTVRRTLPRGALRAMQTPQAFQLRLLLEAYERLGDEALRLTDDCAVVERAGFPVVLCEGEVTNIKITDRLDLVLAEAIAGSRRRPIYRSAATLAASEPTEPRALRGGSDTQDVSPSTR